MRQTSTCFSFGLCCHLSHNAQRFHIELVVSLGEKSHSGFAGNAAPNIKLVVRNKEAPAWPQHLKIDSRGSDSGEWKFYVSGWVSQWVSNTLVSECWFKRITQSVWISFDSTEVAHDAFHWNWDGSPYLHRCGRLREGTNLKTQA
jgi:hypothetical protein